MYKFNLFLSLFNRFVALSVIFSLLVISFSFNIDNEIKKEFGTLYKSTSISDYYNSIANFSYGIINKILESTNIVLSDKTTNQREDEDKKDTAKNKENLAFVKTDNENKIKTAVFQNNCNGSVLCALLNTNFNFNYLLRKFIFRLHMFRFCFITTIFCYFARGNIDIINFNNMIEGNRLV